MKALLVILSLLAFSEAILPRGQDERTLQSSDLHLKFATLFEKCNAGFPILLETRDLPGNNRMVGDPCEADSQCASGLCRCTVAGGKECVAQPTPCQSVDALLALDAECWDGKSGTWNNLGSVPAYTLDLTGLDPSLDGTLRPGAAAGSFHFIGDIKLVHGLDIGPTAHPSLSLEIWVKRLTNRDNREWIVGHDNGGFDRAIALNDDRYGGVAGPAGYVYASTLGYLNLNAWYHVVVTYGAHVHVYLNGVAQDAGPANNGEGTPDMSIGGLVNFAGHDVDALISQVRVYGRELSAADVQTRWQSTQARYGR
jgi:hypothetical protein